MPMCSPASAFSISKRFSASLKERVVCIVKQTKTRVFVYPTCVKRRVYCSHGSNMMSLNTAGVPDGHLSGEHVIALRMGSGTRYGGKDGAVHLPMVPMFEYRKFGTAAAGNLRF